MPVLLLRLGVLFSALLLVACSDKAAEGPEPAETYFSVSQFMDDQWNNRLAGQPLVLRRISRFNNRLDSNYVPLDTVLWQKIRAKMDAGDISGPEFLDQYEFTFLEETVTSSYTLLYEAKDPKLFTRKLSVEVDAFNERIRSLYMETARASRIYVIRQKLFYVPGRLIQIHETESGLASPDKDLLIEYHF